MEKPTDQQDNLRMLADLNGGSVSLLTDPNQLFSQQSLTLTLAFVSQCEVVTGVTVIWPVIEAPGFQMRCVPLYLLQRRPGLDCSSSSRHYPVLQIAVRANSSTICRQPLSHAQSLCRLKRRHRPRRRICYPGKHHVSSLCKGLDDVEAGRADFHLARDTGPRVVACTMHRGRLQQCGRFPSVRFQRILARFDRERRAGHRRGRRLDAVRPQQIQVRDRIDEQPDPVDLSCLCSLASIDLPQNLFLPQCCRFGVLR